MEGQGLYSPISGAENFTLAELCRSDTAYRRGIYNIPDAAGLERLTYLARNVLQPIRNHFGIPLVVTSGYRSPRLNNAIGGSPTSHHCHCQAADVRFQPHPFFSLFDLFEFIYKSLPFTELIAEELPDGWIHVALAKGRENEKVTKYKMVGGQVKRASFDEIARVLGVAK